MDMGVEGFDMLSDSRFIAPLDVNELWDRANELLRTGVTNEVERESDETVRGAGLGLNPAVRGVDCPVISCGLSITGLLPFALSLSSSVHWRCKMIDFVAHYGQVLLSVLYIS